MEDRNLEKNAILFKNVIHFYALENNLCYTFSVIKLCCFLRVLNDYGSLKEVYG